MLPAESHPADIGPFQHYDLGGNVSEWIASPNPMTPLFIGGNFQDTFPVSNLKATRGAPTPSGAPCIGFPHRPLKRGPTTPNSKNCLVNCCPTTIYSTYDPQ